MPECSQLLHLNGLASPRTCALCGLGPCQKQNEVAQKKPPGHCPMENTEKPCNYPHCMCFDHPVHEATAIAIDTTINCPMCTYAPNGVCELHETEQHIQPEDTEEVFKEKFSSSLESQADAMDSAIEAFVDYKDVQGNMMACRSWLRRTAKSIREM